MNILLLNHYAGSPEMGMEFRPYYLAREWIKMGHQVRIIAGDFSHLRIKNPKVKKDFQKSKIDGIEYNWVRTGDYQGNGVRRAFTMFRFVGKLWLHAGKIAEKWKPDVVIASSTYPLDTFAAQRIAKKAKAKLIHEVHDMWPSTLYEIGGMSKKNPFVILMQAAENSAYRNSDNVVSLLPFSKKYMIKHGMKAEKFVYIPNGVVEEEWEEKESIPTKYKDFFEKMHNEDKFIVGYFGGHAISNALDILLDTAKNVNDSFVNFVLIGNGTEKERLKKRVELENIKNIFFSPSVPKRAIPDLLTYFDCIYVGGQPSPLYRFGVCPNKVFDAMMGEKPIICALTASETPVSQYGCGIMVDSGNVEEIVKAIQRVKNLEPEKRKELGNNGKVAIVQNFTYKKLATQFAKIF